ncbi:protein phosphatase 1 regulatory subunit 1C [Triplophysa rosa]|uniref:protein phosphatase 1 regulatory subunit 1C n=1 Tax=Triplophysa rosa TaxID=992332 RepID=UPI00254605F8|nr:protein phosphatase 1 regulatory subunit 1C [Triplophysa rosa]XP_057192648.1 protein phosphatase 1 regulatory subunit 1C [Triplophysa rosa]XP_057192649.1 protein phosphatase 1 regulatory subunit 1C [Triplophysa rosa]
MEPNSPKKIQFAVPLFQSQLDPQAAEHIRKRRPTPATLVIYNEPSVSGDDRQTSGSQMETPNAQLSPAQRKQSVYTPPTMRELQLVVEQHFQRQEQQEAGLSDSPDTPSPITAQHYANAAQWANHSSSEPNGNESYVSSEGQPGSSGAGGREHSDNQQEERESHHPPRLSQKQLDTLSEEPGDMLPRRKDTPYQHQPPFIPGVKLLKNQTDSSSPFQEDEETGDELKDSLRE